ncbi:hypothetical protein BJF85_06480 [Saccharomonospora sp. CUA-673]|nr:hypothetical protein BJF85_06480 [Saccharomonospora sp. CUA-673]
MDPRALSHDHEAHLADAQPGSWIGSVMRVPMRYEAGALRRALRAWTARHEVLRTTVHGDPDTGWQRYSIDLESDVDAVDVEPRVVGSVSASDAHDEIAGFFASVAADVWPHCLFATVCEADGESFAVAFGADHSVMDAYSQLLWFREFASLYTSALAGDSDASLAAVDVGSHVDHSAAARSLDAVITEHDPAVRTWADYLAEDGFPAYGALPASAASVAGKQHSLSRWAAGPDVSGRVEQFCSGLGTGTQSGVLAALGRAVSTRTGSDRVRFVVPMHTRHDRRHADAVGWYVGLCPVEFELSGTDSFADDVGRARAGVSSVRGCAKTSFARVSELLDISAEPRFVVSYVDVRQVPGAARWTEWNARALRAPESSRDELYLWIIHSEHGINVSARCAGTEGALAATEGLIAAFGEALAESVGAEHVTEADRAEAVVGA